MMPHVNRRHFLQLAGTGAAALVLSPLAAKAAEGEPPFSLPKLPYAFDALEPSIDAKTMEIHHDRHHKAYVDGLNKALMGHEELAKKGIAHLLRNLKEVPPDIRTAVQNMGGGHANHSLFWIIMKPQGGGMPSGDLAKAIDDSFGSFDKFQTQLSEAATKRFGSGWGWLVVNKGKLDVLSSANQDSPYLNGQYPLLGIDVWEHAYYLKYQNKRADYVKAWWNVVNWDAVADRYNKARKES